MLHLLWFISTMVLFVFTIFFSILGRLALGLAVFKAFKVVAVLVASSKGELCTLVGDSVVIVARYRSFTRADLLGKLADALNVV